MLQEHHKWHKPLTVAKGKRNKRKKIKKNHNYIEKLMKIDMSQMPMK
jgi:hypothetical protein